MHCKICSKTCTNKTCSKECGMVYRFLKTKMEVTQENVNDFFQKTSFAKNNTLPERWYLYNNNITTKPICKNCGKEYLKFTHNKLSPKCSVGCIPKKSCKICGKLHTNKSSTCSTYCSKTLYKLKEKNIKISLFKEYKNPTLNNMQIINLIENGIKPGEKVECVFCGDKHLTFKHNNKLMDTCSLECANLYKRNKNILNIKELKKYYQGEFQQQLNVKQILDIHRHKITPKKCENCGSVIKFQRSKQYKDVKSCSVTCSRTKHYKNLSKLNEETLISFIQEGRFNFKEFIDFFGISYTTGLKLKKQYGVDTPNKNTEEDNIAILVEGCKRNDRELIRPLELDILHDNFAIEYNGLMWHSSGNSKFSMFNLKDSEVKSKHLIKTKLCEEKNIQLFHIFENEWIQKKPIWESVINSKLGKTEKIYARKCEVKEINSTSSFEDENHLQGRGNSSIKLGLFYGEDMVSIMTFGKSRFNKSYDYELIRYCSKLNTTVVGGASKLLKHFERNFKPKSLISYANRRWSQGGVYEKLGFDFLYNTQPNYFYFREGQMNLYSRNKFQKHKLPKLLNNFNPELTETENMYNNGYRKIYDSGNKVYVKKYK